MKTLHFSTDIEASRQTVWGVLLGRESYRLRTAELAEGSYYEGTWETGTRMRFLVPTGEGMVAEVAEHRPQAFEEYMTRVWPAALATLKRLCEDRES